MSISPPSAPSLVIVGGGTAGWLAAAYLSKVYEKTGLSITLVEAEDVPPIGVGEATIQSLVSTVRVLGRTEAEFLKACDATFKQAIRFDNWRGEGDSYYHPFELASLTDGFALAQHWVKFHKAGETDLPYASFCGVQPRLCEKGLGPKVWNSEEFTAPLSYAYHLDALKFASYLAEIAVANGVTHIRDRVVDVRQAENGDIDRLVLASGREVDGDLFVDCTGFAARLIEGVFGVPLVPVDDMLLCDRAVSARLPKPEGYAPRPYTTATAMEAGWIWDLDLAGRGGSGYVYSSRFTDDDSAAETFARHHGTTPDALDLRIQQMRLGYRERFWVRNCIAIGLSAGFVEPLESTGIHMIEAGIQLLVDNMPTGTPWDALAPAYDEVMRETYEGIVDFVLMHYLPSPRRDSAFWTAYGEEVKPSPRLAELMERWRHRLPQIADFGGKNNLFNQANYLYVIAGLAPELLNDNAGWALKRESGLRMRERVFMTQKAALEQTPAQREFLLKVTSSV